MKRLRSLLERWLPFLPIPPLHPPASGQKPREGLELLKAQLQLELHQARGEALEALELPDRSIFRAQWQDLHFTQVALPRLLLAHSALRDCHFDGVNLSHSSWQIVETEGCTWQNCSLDDARWCGLSLREARFLSCSLVQTHLSLCDLFGAQLEGVNARGATLRGVDLSFATLENVNLAGADLRGTLFAHASLHNVDLEGARLMDADFRGVRGLSAAQRSQALLAGARLHEGLLARGLAALLARLSPSLTPLQLETRARWLSRGLQALALACLALVIGLFVWRGPGADPQAARGAEPEAAPPPGAVYKPTEDEKQRTRAGLLRLREAIQAAYEASQRNGVARYPTLDEVAENAYDADGNGPSSDRVPLMPEGLPQNFVTPGDGLAPYCNQPPTQETLTGDDVDWHYCEETGRVYACGGFTSEPTLSW